MVKVPPLMSALVSFSWRAFSISSSRPGGDALQGQLLHLPQHRHDQALGAERGADADVDVVVKLQPVGVPAAVDRRRDLHRLGGGGDQIGGIGELDAFLRERRLVRLAMGDDRREIRLEHRGDMRRLDDRARACFRRWRAASGRGG